MATRCLLQASIDGVGKYHTTSIFPISIFQIKKGINDKPGTPNYDLKRLALKSLSKRIYPNFVNCDAPGVDQSMGPANTMGCRTRMGKDRHGLPGYGGRGNITPVTINLVDIAIRNGICLGERDKADIDGFWNDLEFMLKEAETALLDRFEWIASKPAKSALFSYENDVMKSTLGRKLRPDEEVREVVKHGTLGVGFIGIAEAMVAMFGETHAHNDEIFDFAYKIVKRIYDFTKEASERNDLNFSCYATPAEGTCNTLADLLRKRYGIIKGVTDREYISNSFHIPVYEEISIYEKIKKEAVFSELCTGGYISYVELESTFLNNLDAVERIVDYAMDCGTYYLAINFPIDTCKDCGYSAEITTEHCPVCGSDNIERLRRVTGYLTVDYRNFNKGKIAEVKDRVKHSKYTRY